MTTRLLTLVSSSVPLALLVASATTWVAAPASAQVAKAPVSKPAPAQATTGTTQAPRLELSEGAKLVARLKAIPVEKQGDPAAVRAAGSAALGRTAPLEDIVLVLVEYQKFAAQEARNDRQFAEIMRSSTLAAKVSQLAQQNAAIDQGMREAGEKANIAMTAAWTGMMIGIAQGLIQIGAATTTFGGAADAGAASVGVAVSDVQLAAVASTSKVTPAALQKVQARADAILTQLVKAQDTKASVSDAVAAVIAADPVLASADRGQLILVVAIQAYQKALSDLAVALRNPTAATSAGQTSRLLAVKRACAAIIYFKAVARKLR